MTNINNTNNIESRANEIIKRLETGEYMKELRDNHSLSLAQLGNKIGISAHFLSELERGIKVGSDLFYRTLAEFYKIDENIFFKKLGRTPYVTREMLDKYEVLQDVLVRVSRSDMSDEQIDDLFERLGKQIGL